MKKTKLMKVLAVTMGLTVAIAMLGGCGSSKSSSKSSSGSGKYTKETWKLATSTGDKSNWNTAAKYFAKLINKDTDGAVTVKVYPSDQLSNGDQAGGVQNVMDGTTDMSIHSNIIYGGLDDQFSVVSLPFLYSSTADVDKVLQGKGFDALSKAADKKGVKLLAIGENGFRDVTNSKREIKTPADMKGLKIRIAGSSVVLNAYKDWGADYTKANWSEVYTGLQTGTYDGQENPIPTADSSSIQEVQKYCTDWTGSYDCLLFGMNKDKFNSLPKDEQKLVLKDAKKAMEYQRKLNRKQTQQMLDKWTKDKGIKVHKMTSSEAAQFSKLSKEGYTAYAKLLVKDGHSKSEVKNYLKQFGITDINF